MRLHYTEYFAYSVLQSNYNTVLNNSDSIRAKIRFVPE